MSIKKVKTKSVDTSNFEFEKVTMLTEVYDAALTRAESRGQRLERQRILELIQSDEVIKEAQHYVGDPQLSNDFLVWLTLRVGDLDREPEPKQQAGPKFCEDCCPVGTYECEPCNKLRTNKVN
jgi:hypothetical protein